MYVFYLPSKSCDDKNNCVYYVLCVLCVYYVKYTTYTKTTLLPNSLQKFQRVLAYFHNVPPRLKEKKTRKVS